MVKHHATSLLPVLFLALLAAATFWLDRAVRLDAPGDDGKHRHDPDFIIDNFTTRRMNLDGSLQQTLQAQNMLHYPDDDSTEVQRPMLIWYGRTPPVKIRSQHAQISKNGEEVHLQDEVHIHQTATPDHPELNITTAELYVYPDKETAHTTTPVTIVNGRSTLQGRGMKADNRQQKYILLGPATGQLLPAPKK